MAQREYGFIDVRLDVSLPNFTDEGVREFLTALTDILRTEFWGGENDTEAEVHEVGASKALLHDGGEVVDLTGEAFA